MAKSRIQFEGEVSVSASSCSRGEPVNVVSANPGAASSPRRASPTCTADGAAGAPWKKSEATRAMATRTRVILYIIAAFGEKRFGDDPRHASQGRKGRNRVLRRARHERRSALDAREGRGSVRLHREPRPA